ncbi:flagella basal body P-ring formation protein FlgA [Rhodocyclus tenuis]|nr:flagellar basal body P-ring formation chaperone FlgA [Rhodocyclus tenuis]MBK1679998.1 flagella basal body P-ring formation protein FlgA [Rhodocyclus tenuis]
MLAGTPCRRRRPRAAGLTLCLALLGGTTLLQAQVPDALFATVDDYLRTQTRGLPGKTSYRIGALDPRTQLAACNAYEPFLPGGARLWGKATVGVRCLGPATWTVYMPVEVSISGSYFVSARPLAGGQPIGPGDIVERQGNLGSLPTSIVTDAAQAIGKTPKSSIGAGQPLRSDLLLAPLAVQQGQNVKLLYRGSGFSVSSDGRALNNAAAGQVVQVRTSGGQTVSGVARADGTVEVSY